MITTTCDVCKKVLPDAEKDVDYKVFLDVEVCIPCLKQFERDMEDLMENSDHYSFHQYWKTYKKELQKAAK